MNTIECGAKWSVNGLAIDTDNSKQQDLYFSEEICVEHLSHPVSGQEYLDVHYPRRLAWFQRLLARQITKYRLGETDGKWIGWLVLIVSIIVTVALGGARVWDIMGWRTTSAVATLAVIIFQGLFKSSFSVIPIFPDPTNKLLTGYDGHNIDNLVMNNSPRWLNDVVYDKAWPEYNRRNTKEKNDRATYEYRVTNSNADMEDLGISKEVEQFLKRYVTDERFESVGEQRTTKVQRGLLLIWAFNRPKESQTSGKLYQQFGHFARNKIARDIFTYISKIKDDRVSPSTKEQFVSTYGPSGTFDENEADALFEELKKVYHNAGPPLRKLLRQLEE